jgi:hypothetical protein
MSKRPRAKLYEWRITRIRSTPAALIGYMQAPKPSQGSHRAIPDQQPSSRPDWPHSG